MIKGEKVYQAGIVGKPNVGKSTFFAAATLVDVKIAPYPFTTIDANRGVGYVRIKCVCKELGVKDNPRNSICIDGYRFVPIELIDVAGLVPDAWKGRGLGNQFLDELRRADVLIHVIDASGSTDSEGKIVKPGSHNPIQDVKFLEKEIDMWMFNIIKRNWRFIYRTSSTDIVSVFTEKLSGLGIKASHVEKAIKESDLEGKKLSQWTDDDIFTFTRYLRKFSKPMIIAANKADIPIAEDFIREMKRELKDYIIIPTSAEAELALRKAAKAGLIKYLPGDNDFEIIDDKKLSPKQLKALDYIKENVLKRWGSTGVQEVINKAFLDLLGMIVVFPVEDENKLTDHKGNVLPDALLVPGDTKPRDLAYMIHTELGEKFIGALDVRTKRRLPNDKPLKHRAIIKIYTRR